MTQGSFFTLEKLFQWHQPTKDDIGLDDYNVQAFLMQFRITTPSMAMNSLLIPMNMAFDVIRKPTKIRMLGPVGTASSKLGRG